MRRENYMDQLAIAASQHLKEQEYWLNQLSGPLTKCSFPYDHNKPRPGNEIYLDEVKFSVKSNLFTRLMKLSRGSDHTLHIILAAALEVILAKYTGATDIIVGTPIYEPEKKTNFINTVLPLRTQLNKDKTFQDILVEVREVVLKANDHQNYPIEILLEKLGLPFSDSDFPLFDAAVVMENIHDPGHIRHLPINTVFSFKRTINEIKGVLAYNSHQYEKNTAEKLVGHFKNVLQAVLSSPDRQIFEIDLLSAGEKEQILCEFNRTETGYPADTTIHQLFRQQAGKTPHHTAIVSSDGSEFITYRQLDKRSDALAAALFEMGVKPDTAAAIMVERSKEFLIGVLGILKAGGAYLPIDPAYPGDRIDFLLKDSGAGILLTGQEYLQKQPEDGKEPAFDFKGIILSLENETLYQQDDLNCDNLDIGSPADLVYVIYTSGSTGRPKGVMIQHHSLINRLKWMQKQFPLGQGDTVLHKTPFTFDVSVWEIFWWGLEGAKVCTLVPGGEKDPTAMVDAIEKNNITVMHFVPSMLNAFLEYIKSSIDVKRLSSLKQVIASGEALVPGQVGLFHQLLSQENNTRLANLYGPTEATVDVSFFDCSTSKEPAGIPIGKPIDNIKLFVVSKDNRLQPIGLSGELCISGAGLARGYLNRPELTAERFISAPASSSSSSSSSSWGLRLAACGCRLYKTGDLARWLPDGNIEYIGRMDNQVKIRGARIELGEIESQLLAYDGIKETVVLARKNKTGDVYLCAYYVSANAFETSELEDHLSEKLPGYMIPNYFVFLEKFPLNPSGKVDRKQLKEPETTSAGDSIPPRNKTEEQLVEIWKQVLGLDGLGITNNFFRIGGDSIKAIKLISTINRQLDTHLKIADLYAHQTIKQLSLQLEKIRPSIQKENYRIVLSELEEFENRVMEKIKDKKVVETIEAIYPMSDIEEGLVFHYEKGKDEAHYHDQPIYQQAINDININRMKKALALMIEKHPALRTGYILDESAHIIYKYRESLANIDYLDISDMPQTAHEDFVRNHVLEKRFKPFNAVEPPLWRLTIFKLSLKQIVILWEFHHAILDGWSTASLMTELNNTYHQLKTQPGFVPEPLKSEYKDFIIDQIIEKRDTANINFWRSELSGYKRLEFPRIGDAKEMKVIREDLGGQVRENLRITAEQLDTNLTHLCFAAYNYTLYMLSYENDITTGMAIHNRPELEDADKMLGCFLNIVPFRITIPFAVKWSDYIGIIDKKVLRVKRHCRLSLFEIVNAIGGKTKDRNPIYDTAFNFIDFHTFHQVENKEAQSQIEEVLDLERYERTNIPLGIVVDSLGDLFQYVCYYSTDFISDDGARNLCGYFRSILNKFIYEPESIMCKDEIISIEEKERLLYDFNDNASTYPHDKTLSQLFEEQAESTPDHVVLVSQDQDISITYRQLNESSNQLANALQERGVTLNDIVGIMMDHSLDMVISILGILKAGAAYLPLDANLPDRRISSILEDCKVSILLTKNHIMRNHSFTSLQRLNLKQIECRVTAGRPNIKNLDMLPVVNRSLINYEKYSKYISMTYGKNSIAMQATRGCPYNCAYCHKIWPKTHVFRSAEHIFKEVQINYELGIRRFSFYDDIFNLNKKNSGRFFEMIIEKGWDIQLFFPGGLRGDILTKDFIDLMIEAGTINVALALETASPRLQELIKKNLILDKFHDNIRYFCEKYPQVILDLYTMHGFPTETEEEAMMTLDFIKNLKWVHFPSVHVLKIYPNTDMEKLAVENGITQQAIIHSSHLAFHELPDTLPFDKNFTREYQTIFLNDYFLSKERLLHVLPHQMKVLSKDEMVQKYDSYLPTEIKTFDDLLEAGGISRDELPGEGFSNDNEMVIPDLHRKMKEAFPTVVPGKNALKLLLLDLSLIFNAETDLLYDPVEPPLGLMALMSYINREFGSKVKGKIAQSRIDFDSYKEMRTLLNEFKPDIIGVRTLGKFKDFFHKTVSAVREWNPRVPIISGGPYATSEYESILQDKNIDLVVRGEGELTFAELVEKIIENKGKLPDEEVLSQIAGLAFVPGRQKQTRMFACEIFMLDETRETLLKKPTENIGRINRPTDLAYVIYTSGSTGKPKGVMVEHRSVVNLCAWHNKAFNVTGRDNTLLYANYCFDASVWELFPYLLKGSVLHIINGILKIDIERLNQYFNDHNISISFLPTQVCEQFIRLENNSLRILLTGGDKLNTWTGKKYQIFNNYGPTENSVVTTSFAIDENYDNIPIGKPITNIRVYIVDRGSGLLPVGIPGELCIGGDGLCRGYLNNQELTRKKFVPNPFKTGERMYKTGDISRWLPNGNIEFSGRMDRQVKIRAYRIELGEIERQLLSYERIKEGVVAARQNEKGDKYLCAYIVPFSHPAAGTGNETLDISELRKFLLKHLPEYMIPDFFVQLEKLPLTHSGKVDRKALPSPTAKAGGEYIAPGGVIEEKLSEIWGGVLGIPGDSIGINSNFFELGGHSLNATVMNARIHKELNVKLPVDVIFRTQTLRRLAEYLKDMVQDKYTAVQPVEKKDYYIQSSAQKRLYILHQMEPESTAYNIPGIIRLPGDTGIEKLEAVFHRLVGRHESLRTSFHTIRRQPVQVVHDTIHFKMERPRIIKDFIRAFDLSRPPLFRAGLIHHPAQDILLVDMHHIISDGVSHQILAEEFMHFYSDSGEALPPLKLQYRDYGEWQTGSGQGEAIKKQEEFWLKEFAGEIPILDLPTDYPRPEFQSFEGDRLNFELDEHGADALEQLALSEGATLFMVLLALYNVLLAKLSGQEEIIIGIPVAARQHADLEKIIGMFVNTVALRNYPQGEKTFRTFLIEVKERSLKAFENQEYPFEDIVEKVSVQRDASRNPLFDAMFTWQNPDEPVEAADVEGYEKDAQNQFEYKYENLTAKFDLILHAAKVGKRLGFTCEYCTKLFKRETLERFVSYFKEIVSDLIVDHEKKLKDIRFVSEAEKKKILYEFNDTRADYPGDITIQQLFRRQAGKTADHTAVVNYDGSEFITYSELDRRSDALAEKLTGMGVKPGAVTVIMVERSKEFLVGVMGILKAGGAYLPIDPAYPQDRIDFLLADSGADILLTKQEYLVKWAGAGKEPLSKFDGTIVRLEDNSLYRRRDFNRDVIDTCSPGDPVYIIYTSGSTGRPKGVPIRHHSLINRLKWMQKQFPLTPGDTILYKTPFTFDVSVWEIFWWGLEGAKVCWLEPGGEKDPAAIIDAIETNKVTVMHFVPSMLHAFLEYTRSSVDIKRLSSLKQVIASGEALLPGQVKLFAQLLSQENHTRLANLYGPTEASIDVSFFNCSAEKNLEEIPIGKPIDNIKLFVLNADNHLQPIGLAGELCISGVGLAGGYLNRPDLTAEKFVPNPFYAEITRENEYDIMYRTGDLACWMPDGNIRYIGRMDHQVKIRGFRIELGEIENLLLECDGLNESVVLVRKNKDGDRYLCAYIVSEKDFDSSKAEAYLSEKLPAYMVPSHFVSLEKIPLTPNGKVDKKALPEPEISLDSEYTAPGNDIEKTLVPIWSEVLAIEEDLISVDANFFKLGGQSLKATLLTAKVHDKLNVKLPLAQVFKTPTIRKLAEFIAAAPTETPAAIQPVEKKIHYVASSAQKRLYILQQMDAQGTAYNMPEMIPLVGTPDVKKLEETFKKLIRRHESLRTSFHMIDDQPFQRVEDEVELKIQGLTVTPDTPIGNLITHFNRPFDLSRAPLLRVGLLKTESQRHILIVNMHHIISDGVSHEILVRDFAALHDGTPLPPLRLQYKDYAEWQTNPERSSVLQAQENFWTGRFNDEIPVLDLPTDFPRPVVQGYDGGLLRFQLEEEQLRALKEIGTGQETTTYMTVLAVYLLLLYKITGQEDVVVGTDVAGRTHHQLGGIIGMFVNTLPLRERLTGDQTFIQVLRQIKQDTLQALQNQDYPFEELVEKVAVNRDTSRNPLFDVMYSFLDQDSLDPGTDQRPGPLDDHVDIAPYIDENLRNTSKFDLSLNAGEVSGNLFLSFEYCTRLFKEETIRRFIGFFKKIVSSLVRQPNHQVSGIEIISPEEKKQILFDFNNTSRPMESDKSYTQLFEDQVSGTPDKIAVIHKNRHITYRELNRQSLSIAGILKEKGLTVNKFALLYLERSPWMLTAILGVFKAGGAYVPIDIDYPSSRVAYIVENSRSGIIITDNQSINGLQAADETISLLKTKTILNLEQEPSTSRDDYPGSFPLTRADDLVYMIYTSGTTGQPKGVMIHQLGMINHLYAKIEDFSVSNRDIIAQTASAGFDISVWQFLVGPMMGGSTCIIDRETVLEPRALLQVVRQQKITILELVPSLLAVLLETTAQIPVQSKSLPYLRTMISTGEPLTHSLAQEWYRQYPGIKLANAYGPTEASDDITHYIVEEAALETQTLIPIGKPVRNLHVYILDKHFNLCPVGIKGEICTAGLGVGKGYREDMEKTRVSFIPNPFLDTIGDNSYARLYRTGDIGYFNPDGSIQCLGRLDHQVKIRGNRIELSEIRHHILSHPQVSEAVVLARGTGGSDGHLCAYIVYTTENPVATAQLKLYLAKNMPDYMIPSYFVEMEKLPLTPNGKVDHKALPRPEVKPGLNKVEPRDGLEKKLEEIWTRVLGVGRGVLGIDTNFFELGGNSLMGMMLMARIHKELHVKVPLAELFKTPRIRELAEFIRGLEEEHYITIEPIEEKEYYVLSSAQSRIYVSQQMDLRSINYNIPIFLTLEGDVSKEKLEASFKTLITRHEGLRTSFLLVGEEFFQVIRNHVDFEIKYYDFSEKASPAARTEAIVKGFKRPFDLSAAPLLRCGLIKISTKEYVLMVDLHHIISDGVSMNILIKDFANLYSGQDLPPLLFRYRDYAEWENSERQKIAMKQQEEYWLKRLSGDTPLFKLPTDYSRPEIQNFEGDMIKFEINETLSGKINEITLKTGTTLYMVLLAAYNVLLSAYSKKEDILVGSPITGRPGIELREIIGMFVNIIVMRNFPGKNKTVREFLMEVKDNTLEAFQNEFYQFDQLVDKLGLNRNLSDNPLIDTVFTLQNAESVNVDTDTDADRAEENAAEFKISFYPRKIDDAKFDLTLDAIEVDGGLKLWFTFSTALFKRATIEKMKKYYLKILEEIVQDIDIKIKDIPIYTDLVESRADVLWEDEEDFGF